MNRTKLLKLLARNIPTLADSNDPECVRKIYRDSWYLALPTIIPENYLVGETIETISGRISVTQKYSTKEEKELNERLRTPEGRRICFDYMIYPNGKHYYGKLEIDGVECMLYNKLTDKTCRTSIAQIDVPQDKPQLKNARFHWQTELMREVAMEDLNDTSANWESYHLGDRTSRFSNLIELYSTALYVAIARVQGPMYMTMQSMVELFDKNKLEMLIDKHENIFISENMLRTLGIK